MSACQVMGGSLFFVSGWDSVCKVWGEGKEIKGDGDKGGLPGSRVVLGPQIAM